jgi:hypothetical protein
MIVGTLPDEPTPSEAPPSYDTLDASRIPVPVEKGTLEPQCASASDNPTSPIEKSPSSSSSKGKGTLSGWFNFSAFRTTCDVRTTVLLLIRDLVQEQHATGGIAINILESCAEACAARSLSLSTLLQSLSRTTHHCTGRF